jgi:hypothetical protein
VNTRVKHSGINSRGINISDIIDIYDSYHKFSSMGNPVSEQPGRHVSLRQSRRTLGTLGRFEMQLDDQKGL